MRNPPKRNRNIARPKGFLPTIRQLPTEHITEYVSRRMGHTSSVVTTYYYGLIRSTVKNQAHEEQIKKQVDAPVERLTRLLPLDDSQ